MKVSVVIATLLLGVSAHASRAKCFLKVDGKIYINGICNLDGPHPGGTFSITDGKTGTSAYISIIENIFHGSWNGAHPFKKADQELGRMTNRNRACRYNDRATICAWAL